MPKLNQIIALVTGKKTKTQEALTGVYHNLQKATLFDGISRTYVPLDENGETQPSEKKLVQYRASDAMIAATETLTELFDVIANQEYTNTKASANVVVDGRTILSSVPVTYLLFLEKQLVNVHTFVGKLPTLDPAEQWTFSQDADSFVSERSVRNSTKKILRNHVRAEATDKHPAQVDTYTEDVKIGEWTTVKFSGAIAAKKKNEILSRVEKLQEAVKMAREEANLTDASNVSIGGPVFKYLFG